MFGILVALFIFVPIIEIGLFIQVGGLLGLWPTLLIVLLTAVIGASLVRSQGIQTMSSVQSRLNQGEMPAQQIIEGVLLAVAGVLLLTPGFMTDIFGLSLLLPRPRAWFAQQVLSRVQVQTFGGFQSGSSFSQENPFYNEDSQGQTFEGEYDKKENDPNKQLK